MRSEWLQLAKRVTWTVLALVAAVGLIVRANTFSEPTPGMTGPVMCVLSGLFLVGTTIAINLRSREPA